MKLIRANKSCTWTIYVLLPLVAITSACYHRDSQKPDLDTQPKLRNEKRFPTGTTIGKYTYMDNEGNPVQMKYYADEASSGVELNSVKVANATGEPFPSTMIVQNPLNSLDPDSDTKTITEILNKDIFSTLKDGY